MKRIFKSLFRRGEANLIKILCLGVGMAIGMVMLAEVIFERSYDNFLPHPENTYQVGERFRYNDGEWDEFGQTPGAVAPGIKRYYPQVEAATRFTWVSEDMTFVTEQKEKLTGDVFLCDSSFFDVFPRKIIVGENPHEGLNRPNNVYISERLYKALGEQIMGKSVSWVLYPEVKGKIAGVFEDFPENTHLPQIDMAIAMPTIGQIMYDGSNNWLGNDRYRSYIRLKEGHRIEELKDVKQILLDKVPSDVLKDNPNLENLGLYFTPIMEIHTSSDYVRIINIVLFSFGLIMLAVTVLNYILLTISSMVNRAKTIATYRCYGAKSGNIYQMVLSESCLHCFIGLALAVLIIFSLQDFLQEQMGHSLSSLFPMTTILGGLGIVALIILICGLMPGYLYTRIPVTYAYRRYTESKRYWKLGLLFFQFMLTTFFISILTVIGLEYNTLTGYNPGFNYKNVFYANMWGVPGTERSRCVEELKRLPNVKYVSWGSQLPFDGCAGNNVYNPETGLEYMNIGDMYYVGPDYHKLFDIKIIDGKEFIPEWKDTTCAPIMVSRDFVEQMRTLAGWKGSAIGKSVFLTGHGNENPGVIQGVYENIRLGSQIAEEQDERATVMFYNAKPTNNLFIRLQEMGPEKIQEIQDVVTRTMPSQEVKVYSVGLEMDGMYTDILHVRNYVLFAGICILIIALIGLTAYIRDEVSRRRSEIAIRIIHGASVGKVQKIFLQDLLKIAIPATVIGALLAVKVSAMLLQLFAVKIELTWYLFGGCIMAVLFIVLALAALLILKAARMNPTENLRTE